MRVLVTDASSEVGARVVSWLEADPDVEYVSTLGLDAGTVPPDPDALTALLRPIHGVVLTAAQTKASAPVVRLLVAAGRAGVSWIVAQSSGSVYRHPGSPTAVDEAWPLSCELSTATVRERQLDSFERLFPWTRVVRVRHAPLPEQVLVRRRRHLPARSDSLVQVVHPDDLGHALVCAALVDVDGPVNVASDEVVSDEDLVHAHRADGYRLRPGPRTLLDVGRAGRDLQWRPVHTTTDALTAHLVRLAGRAAPRVGPTI